MATDSKEADVHTGPAAGRRAAEQKDALVAGGVLAALCIIYFVLKMPAKGVLILLAAVFCIGAVTLARRSTRESKGPQPRRRSGKKKRR